MKYKLDLETIYNLSIRAGIKFDGLDFPHYDDFDYEKFAYLLMNEMNKKIEALETEMEFR